MWPHADPTAARRFASKVHVLDIDDCWIWTGAIDSDGGYGRFRPPAGRLIAAHRWSYLHHHGHLDWPVVRHRCDVRICVNPHHLQAGTQAANVTDMVQRGACTTTAHTGTRSWPTLAYRLRNLAQTGDTATIRELLTRPTQLELDIDDAV